MVYGALERRQFLTESFPDVAVQRCGHDVKVQRILPAAERLEVGLETLTQHAMCRSA